MVEKVQSYAKEAESEVFLVSEIKWSLGFQWGGVGGMIF